MAPAPSAVRSASARAHLHAPRASCTSRSLCCGRPTSKPERDARLALHTFWHIRRCMPTHIGHSMSHKSLSSCLPHGSVLKRGPPQCPGRLRPRSSCLGTSVLEILPIRCRLGRHRAIDLDTIKRLSYAGFGRSANRCRARYRYALCTTQAANTTQPTMYCVDSAGRDPQRLETAVSRPPPPKGYSSWLDFAVASMDSRSAALEYLFSDDEGKWTAEDMARAARDELEELRRQTGQRG